ncbi:AmmeMemoRadiSam system protein B [Desulfonatronospira sp.]|uniref:AmmeMemoRadiSam system protein B n=1 Tax=Desulfonatronospira sp. TaxID=1962951 RepID=UPI0025C4155B|nr:AmmeMemoRadiSam system protein B [Desulfonatronospira sp.]
MDREPFVAGQFYPGSATALDEKVSGYLQGEQADVRTLLAMVPHAGYPFSGAVAGKVIARSNLADRIVLLGPNHTGRGRRIAVWGDGSWLIPGNQVPVDEQTASVVGRLPGYSFDYQAHLGEHSLEVVLPFLARAVPGCKIIPIAVAEPDPQVLMQAGRDLARTVKDLTLDVSLVVSTDMSHFVPQEHARRLDHMAIEKILDLDPQGLHQVVTQNRISMCGVMPATLGLACAMELGGKKTEFIDYATSGDAMGDYSQVVGYAGVVVS